jgi:hypothetical protein
MRRAIVPVSLAGLLVGCLALSVLAPIAPAGAAWTKPSTGSGYSRAKAMPAGNTPTVSVSGSSVTVSWAASSFSGGGAVSGYLVKRYSSGGAPQTIGTNCAGTISALTCTENAVPAGSWKYSVTPKQSNWLGAESPQSSAANVTVTISTSAWDLRDDSGAESNQSSAVAFATDTRTAASGNFATAFSTSRYVQWDYNAPLQTGLGVSGANFNFSFFSKSGETGCVYFEVRRASTGAVIGTHGSSATPLACDATGVAQASTTALPEVTSSDIANDLRVRIYAKQSSSHGITVDLATISGSAASTAFTLYDTIDVDSSTGTPTSSPWALASSGDGAVFTSANNWQTSFNTLRYLKITFPSYVPSGATLNSASFVHAYRTASSGTTTCHWFEVYSGVTLVTSRGNSTTPYSCNSSNVTYVTDTVSLPEVNTPAKANGAIVKMYVRDSGSKKSTHDLASLTLNYTP